jgi:uncharacterized RDD family membrane protein YckC
MGEDVCSPNPAEPHQDDKDATHSEVIMRALFAFLALSGVAGIVFGVLTMLSGDVPFSYENYGGPGSLIGGLLLAAVGLYLLFNWGRFESSKTVHRD